jgi:hypothetical protein
MRCMITTSSRATATWADIAPRRRAGDRFTHLTRDKLPRTRPEAKDSALVRAPPYIAIA